MKLQFRLAIAAVSAVLVGGCQTPGPNGTVVTGTGDPSKDVPAVQAAVDRGGTVVLSGNFNFGDKGRVTVRRDVAVTGRGETRIQGGFWTFFSPLPEALPAQKPGPQISIRNIQFAVTSVSDRNFPQSRFRVFQQNRPLAAAPRVST